MKVSGQNLPPPGQTDILVAVPKVFADVNASGVYSYVMRGNINATDSVVFDLGAACFAGNILGISIEVNDTRTGGDIVATLSVDGVDTLAATIDGTNPAKHTVASPRLYGFAALASLQVTAVSTGYTTGGSLPTEIRVQVHLENSEILSPITRDQGLDRLRAYMAVAYNIGAGTGTPIIWDTIEEFVGRSIDYNTTTGIITLRTPGTYLLIATVEWYASSGSPAGAREFSLYDRTAAAFVPAAVCDAICGTSASNLGGSSKLTVPIFVESETEYEVRKEGSTNANDRIGLSSNLHVMRIG